VKRSGDRVIGRSGDRIVNDCRVEDLNEISTTEARRHGEGGEQFWSVAARTTHYLITLAYKRLYGALQIAVAALREIFDESAYDRFLERTHAGRSVASYREFLKEREVVAARRPRCC
jgi:hypothetical protein